MRCATPHEPDFFAVRGRHLLIALSGGADSVALACMLAQARETHALRLTAAHLDHGIRPESAEDAEFCRRLCARLNIPLRCARIDVPAEAARTHQGLETVARRLRYDWLQEQQRQAGADLIALAHHMDDQAETVLMHLARGAGPEGIGGMAPMRGGLYRPLLGLRKHDLEAYLHGQGVLWREDATNAVADTPRNALRLHVLPQLEKCYPQAVAAIARCAESARVESDFIAGMARDFQREALSEGPYGRHLHLADGVHPALVRRAIRDICGADLPWSKVIEIEALCAAPRGKLEISGSLNAERGRRGIYFLPKQPPSIPEVPLALSGSTVLPRVCEIEVRSAAARPIREHPLRQALNPTALQGAVLRTRRPGDRFRPLGCGDRLLSDFFIDRKLDRPLRDCTALVARGNRVLWVCGLAIAEEAKLSDGCEAVELDCRYTFDMSLGIDK